MELDYISIRVFDFMFDGIAVVNSDGKIMYANQSLEKIIGLKKQDIINNHYMSVFPQKSINRTMLKGSDKKEIHLKGKHLYFRSIPYIEDDTHKYTIVVFKDVTVERDSDSKLEELMDSLGMMKDIVDHANQGMVLVDKDGRIIKWNYEKLLGKKEEQVLGKPIEDVIENTRLHIVVKTGKKELCDVQRIQGHDMLASRTPIIKDGKIIGAVGTVLFKDVKELKSLAQKLELLEDAVDKYKGEIRRMHIARYSFENIISKNKRMERLKEIAMRSAESNSTVLIQGESGTGKEYFAHAIHKASNRKFGAFISINCAAIPKELLESELFGYEEGAFTGAKKEGRIGKFELANGGTILLDEIGTMPLEMQAKLLRVLEEKEFERIGGNKRIDLDVRVIASTNEDLEELVEKGKFRRDLYYRLNVIRIYIPPLRERLDDIPILTEYILGELVSSLELEPKEISPEVISIFQGYSWPGNVRELRNVIERALNIARGDVIFSEHLPEYLQNRTKKINDRDDKPSLILKDVVSKAEIDAIKRALKESGGNRTLAAKILGIHRTALYKKIDAYGLQLSDL